MPIVRAEGEEELDATFCGAVRLVCLLVLYPPPPCMLVVLNHTHESIAKLGGVVGLPDQG